MKAIQKHKMSYSFRITVDYQFYRLTEKSRKRNKEGHGFTAFETKQPSEN
jgi:hypothetical protein